MRFISEPQLAGIHKILVLQQRQIGDVVLVTPAVELLKKRFPTAELHIFTEKKCAPLLYHNPCIDRIWEIDKKELNSFAKELAFYRKVASQKFDLVVDFQQMPRCLWVTALSRAAIRLSYRPPWYRRLFYTHWADMPDKLYSAAKKASILHLLGADWNGERPKIYFTAEERESAKNILKESGLSDGDILISLDCTHRRITRKWPLRHYARLVDIISARFPLVRFLLLYGPGEEEDVNQLAGMVENKAALIEPIRPLGLRGTAACIERAVLHVGNCSAPRHMATAAGTPTLTILGSSDIYWDYPSLKHKNIALGADCQPCNRDACQRGLICLENLMPERVAGELAAMLILNLPELAGCGGRNKR